MRIEPPLSNASGDKFTWSERTNSDQLTELMATAYGVCHVMTIRIDNIQVKRVVVLTRYSCAQQGDNMDLFMIC